MSEIKVNKITPRVACGTTQLGDSGDTFTIPSGATITNSGTATGFGATGAVSWDTTKITADPGPAVTGTGYFCDTTGGAFTVTLPLSPSAGDVVGVSDYAKTWDTDNLTLGRNGSNINGNALDSVISTEGLAVTLVYVDATKGWIVTDTGLQSDAPGPVYVAATGGTPCSGAIVCTNYKVHTFTGPGTFCVSCAGNCAGSNTVDYLVSAGGGGAGGSDDAGCNRAGGGGAAGGFRESPGAASGCYSVSPLGASPAVALSVPVQGYPITVGSGGTGGEKATPAAATNGNNSVFSTITSAGGGSGGTGIGGPAGISGDGADGGSGGGGSGGGSGTSSAAGDGNTPPVSPAQGTNGATGSNPPGTGGGGGGATVAGTVSPGVTVGGGGGAGATTSISATPTTYNGGGGGGGGSGPGSPGPGGGAAGSAANDGQNAGTVNTGGGGGGAGFGPESSANSYGGAGGSGIVIIRYKFQ